MPEWVNSTAVSSVPKIIKAEKLKEISDSESGSDYISFSHICRCIRLMRCLAVMFAAVMATSTLYSLAISSHSVLLA